MLTTRPETLAHGNRATQGSSSSPSAPMYSWLPGSPSPGSLVLLIVRSSLLRVRALVSSQHASTYIGMCGASNSLGQILSPYRLTAFFTRAGNVITGASSTRNGSGGVRSVPTVSHLATVQNSGPIPTLDPNPQTGPTASV